MGRGPSPDRLAQICRSTLDRIWRQGARGDVRYAYTAPSGQRYPWQWYWGSCFTAIAWGRFDRSRARAELESLVG